MKTSRKQGKSQRGFATAFVLMVIFVLSVIGFALGSRGIMNLQQSFHTKQVAQAFYATQAGVALAIYALKQNDANIPTGCGQTTVPTTLKGEPNPQILSNKATYTVTVTNNYGGTCTINVMAPDGTSVPPSMLYITSRGTSGAVNKLSSIMAYVTKGWNYPYAVFGKNSVTLSGNALTDSYNSCNGPYGGANLFQNGNVGTNSSANSAVTLSGNAKVNGNVSVGPGGIAGSPTISTSGSATYNSASVLSSPVSLPPVTDPLGGYGAINVTSGVINPGKYGSISVSGNNTVTLNCGTYSIGSISVSGNGKIIVNCLQSNPVKIYVYNGLTVSGNGFDNTGQNPTGLFIYGMPSLTSAAVTGNGQAYYALYAPSADISTTGNGNIYGSVVGNSVTDSGNANIHYDQCLSTDLYAGGTTVTLKAWNSQ